MEDEPFLLPTAPAPGASPPTKVCPAPEHVGERRIVLDQFHRNANAKGGHANWCIACINARKRRRREDQAIVAATRTPLPAPAPSRMPAWRRAPILHGEQYTKLLAAQGGVCRRCRHPPYLDAAGQAILLDHYVYSVEGVGSATILLHDACSVFLRLGGDDPRQFLAAADLLLDLGEAIRRQGRLHTEEA